MSDVLPLDIESETQVVPFGTEAVNWKNRPWFYIHGAEFTKHGILPGYIKKVRRMGRCPLLGGPLPTCLRIRIRNENGVGCSIGLFVLSPDLEEMARVKKGDDQANPLTSSQARELHNMPKTFLLRYADKICPVIGRKVRIELLRGSIPTYNRQDIQDIAAKLKESEGDANLLIAVQVENQFNIDAWRLTSLRRIRKISSKQVWRILEDGKIKQIYLYKRDSIVKYVEATKAAKLLADQKATAEETKWRSQGYAPAPEAANKRGLEIGVLIDWCKQGLVEHIKLRASTTKARHAGHQDRWWPKMTSIDEAMQRGEPTRAPGEIIRDDEVWSPTTVLTAPDGLGCSRTSVRRYEAQGRLHHRSFPELRNRGTKYYRKAEWTELRPELLQKVGKARTPDNLQKDAKRPASRPKPRLYPEMKPQRGHLPEPSIAKTAKAKRGRKPKQSAQFYQKFSEDWEQSGFTLKEFAEARGIDSREAEKYRQRYAAHLSRQRKRTN